METMDTQERDNNEKKDGFTFEDFGNSNLYQKKHKKMIRKNKTETSAKERLLILKYLIDPKMKKFMKNVHYIALLDKLCDLDETTIKSASKDLPKKFAGYTKDVYLKELKEIRDLFISFLPKSYNEVNPADRHNYHYLNDIITRIDNDIQEAKKMKSETEK